MGVKHSGKGVKHPHRVASRLFLETPETPMQSLGSSGRSPRIPTIAATQKWPQNLHSNYVIVLLFSVNLVKEETGKKA